MKNNQLILVLVGMLFLMLVLTGLLVYQYNSSINKSQEMQTKIGLINNTRMFTQSLYNDATEYSKRNPAIIPLLQAVTNGTLEAAAPAPAARPSAK